jgi:hypothetical protein
MHLQRGKGYKTLTAMPNDTNVALLFAMENENPFCTFG